MHYIWNLEDWNSILLKISIIIDLFRTLKKTFTVYLSHQIALKCQFWSSLNVTLMESSHKDITFLVLPLCLCKIQIKKIILI